ncbi:MAG: T9SS type A sorting domain-containing protein [Candidatus Zixiibacteriota bacterium]|nr:MAG: T9SS type A sorting domain-containing protein [candidate division Zixibacteria bacterium]
MKRISAISAAAIICLCAFCWATVINIPGDYLTIQQGIDAGSDGDTVLVQPGTYVENINFNGHNIVLGSLYLTTGDTSYIEQTVIDGDSAGTVVTFESGENNSTALAGFTIQNGSEVYGAGVKIINANPVITHNLIRNNLGGYGGGIYCENTYVFIGSNVIEGNGAYTGDDGYGGGVFCTGNSAPIIANNRIKDNSAGGTWYGEGGGISIQSQSAPILTNNLIIENGCSGIYGGAGGGICSFSESIIINNMVINNYASGTMEVAGGVYCGNNTTLLVNNIIRENSLEEIIGTANALYCNIEGGWPGSGNIDTNPLFRNPASGDFHLMSIACGDSANSPCIDAGDPMISDIVLDCDWGLGTIISDMGAYGGGDSGTVGIIDNGSFLPKEITLLQNYPNPFNSGTTIRFSIVKSTEVRLAVYDMLGRKVRTLIDKYKQAGVHTANFDATDLSSGVYFYRLQAGEAVATRPMVLLR